MNKIKISQIIISIITATCLVMASSTIVLAANASSLPEASPNPQNGSVGLQGTLGTKPPTQGATITTPTNGAVYSTGPITIAGLCQSGLLVKIFTNNVFVGSAQCTNNSFSLQVSLFNGTNQLVAKVFDALDQPGPPSSTITTSFQSGQFNTFGSLMSITSSFAERGANPGQQLVWPITINGGTPPYAVSVDWGDGTKPELISDPFSGNKDITHIYQNAGTYKVTIEATDKNNESAFLQLVGVADGPASQSLVNTKNTASQTKNTSTTSSLLVWWPTAVSIPLIISAFWLGRKHELFVLRKRIEESNQNE